MMTEDTGLFSLNCLEGHNLPGVSHLSCSRAVLCIDPSALSLPLGPVIELQAWQSYKLEIGLLGSVTSVPTEPELWLGLTNDKGEASDDH